ncbi:ral GTPase-activating protein subunit alpha-2 isoform X3 [Anolis carolinensis]|uniref:ral GTPase-activating protein subunit alpha-2 isoform X3 n=1 Tax=Anolis carolinensis TaxID=28377 RepID=UPI000462DA86|nr:PREDICTED: ral GTPase-activating protein subunit alpha-2 isoform X1 [Anolis carolinensis]|eukprot:XP_008107296.1 PREDICTED: ral GTPase-activating protein subunit alpha-2 isoform X1 [Anolis carolinensis]
MFSRRGHADVKKSAQKALDPRKDVLTRLKHLRALMDAVDGSELKHFFEINYSQIYFIFYENFITLESNLKQKGNKSQREELDSILFLFERILQLLPERIFYRWHFHSIGSVLKKLLHTGNSLKIRCEGIRLFLLWLQALQTNCSEEQLLIFACLVPGFPAVMSSKGPCTLDTIISSPSSLPDAKIFPEEITPLLPHASGEKSTDDPTCSFLQILLKYMVIQAASLEWKNKENHDTGFKFLFALFRKYYLPHLFPSFTKLTNLYKPVLDIPGLRPKPSYVSATCNNENVYSTKIPYMTARVVFIKWIVNFFLEKKYFIPTQNSKNGGDVLPRIIQTVGGAVQDKNPEPENSVPPDQEKSHSNNNTLSERRLSDSSFCSIEEQHRAVYEMVQQIFLSTRGYVNFVNEVFRQAFLLPSSEISSSEKVVKVYRKWILQEKPAFMEEPDMKEVVQDDDGITDNSTTESDGKHLSSGHSGHKRSSSWGRTYSFSSAVNRGCILEDENKNIKAGLQAALQVFLTNAANVFLLEPCTEIPELLKEQIGACRAVLSIFRRMIMELPMNQKTWEQMLQILLRITEAVMSKSKDNQMQDTFAQSLASVLFRTLIVAWIRANLSVYISRELWDELLRVLSSLTDWRELIAEWANIMDSLTSVLARTVYGVDMTNLPLDKLSEQKEKIQRGKCGILEPQKGASVGRSFSLSWRNHPEVVEPMRFRSATTSGVPGVEKARNIVRQRATEAEEYQQSENGAGTEYSQSGTVSRTESNSLFSDQEQLTRSSSTSDIRDQCNSLFHVRKTESSQNLNSDSNSAEETKGVMNKENTEEETNHIPAESYLKVDMQQSPGSQREREKSESVSSDTSLGYSNEVDITMAPWQSCEENHDVNIPSEISGDPDACHWLHLNPSDATNLTDSSEFLADDCSIIAGGNLIGWHPDSASVLWRRILGILGDVNNIKSPKIHAMVFEFLYELWYKLAKIRDNLAISLDNQSTPAPPILIPPLRIFASWLFKAATLPDDYKEGKLHSYKLICAMMTRRQDFVPNPDFLVHFYLVMHIGLNSKDQDILNTIIRHCSPCFFFLSLPGFTLLIGDFVRAAATVLSTNMLEAPRLEAHTILGSLICFPNLYQEISLLQPILGAEVIPETVDVKCFLISTLLKNAIDEPSEASRCLAVCCLGLWICEELVQCTNHPQVKDAINVLGVTLKFSNKQIAQEACDVFQLLASYWEKLQLYKSCLPIKIIEILVATITFLLPSAEYSSVESDKKFIVSLLLCLLDWCMALPVKMLLEPVLISMLEDQHSSKAPLLDYIYRVLHSCVHGSNTYTQQSHYLLSLADLSSDVYDPFLPLASVRNSEPIQFQSSEDLNNLLTVAEERRRRSLELIPLTARMIMAHLVNHLGHYPLNGGPAVLHSLISENHNNSYVESSELSSEVFRSPNLQLFVFNDSTLISYLQIPSERRDDDEPPGTLSEVRVIVRDISGKYSWDGKLMHGPLAGCPPNPNKRKSTAFFNNHKQNFESQVDFIEIYEGDDDVLDKLLERIGNSSPECLLRPQVKLNEPSASPCVMSSEQENDILEAIIKQNGTENEYAHGCSLNPSMKAEFQKAPKPVQLQAPFHLCKLLLNDLGMNSWDKRKSFHLLKKNSKLLRELKNLDSRQCRETHKIAVFYIAEGQEDKCSILSNPKGSQAYEDFVAGLGWEVDLSTHCGFMGGLQRNGSTGQTAPYYATSTVEVIFHVSTRMPSDSDDSLTKKLRHLGNDEIHVVWSEHTRNYRRGIIPTDFGDVLIIIYPMKNHMFFIEIMKKPEVPFFGPLFDGAIVTAKLLPNLIRATCINASRAVKSLITLYQSFYEERALYLEAIIQNHKEVMTFEDFAAQVFSPSPSYSLGGCGSLTTSLSADLTAPVGAESAEQMPATLAGATKNKLSGKLRRSASALSKSSS